MDPDKREIIDGVDLTPGAYQDWRGVDVTLIRHCLSLTPTERLAENDEAIELLNVIGRSRDVAR